MTERERIQRILFENGLVPNRALGQNFLVDDDRLMEIRDAARVEGCDVLEIGPGLGALTRPLLSRARRVVAVEKDARLAEILAASLKDPRLTVRTEDFLDTDAAPLFQGEFHAVGNLPYYVTTPIVEKLLSLSPASMTLMVQREAAERFFARPRDRVYGPVAVLSQSYYAPERVMDVPPGCFYPQPEVDSSVVRLTRRADAPTLPPGETLSFLRRAFSMRRKTLLNNLKGVPGAAEALAAAGAPPDARAEALPPEVLTELGKIIIFGGRNG